MQEISIAGRRIGPDHPPYVICELSGNHNGELARALKMLEAAKATGADAVKLQTYTADTITLDHDSDQFRIKGGLWDGRRLYELYQEASTPWEWHEALFAKARDLGITIFSTPFDKTAVDLLESLDAPAYKVASFEVVDLPLVEYIASKKKPMIISTGLANLAEIQDVIAAARRGGADQLVVLHCISAYPAPMEDANLRTIPNLSETFGVISGLSDHTMGTAASVTAIALGGSVIEKHFTLARADGGPDSAFSLEPEEFTRLVEDSKATWAALGRVRYDLKGSEAANIVFRRSLYVTRDVAAGETLTEDNVRSIRPGYGLPPKHLPEVLGRRASRDLARGEPLAWPMVE